MTQETSLLAAALAYTAQGFKVLPLCWPTPDGECGCGHQHTGPDVGKAPLTTHGLKDATQTQAVVREYWHKWPQANIGIATDGLTVPDFDSHHGGLEGKSDLETIFGPLPRTRTHRTGGGGEHWLYRSPNGANIRSTVTLGGYTGVDLRANGGYIVAPPSLHRSGNRYEVMDDAEIAPAPEWLIDLATKRARTPETVAQGEEVPINDGERNVHLTSLAGSMRRRGMSEDAIRAALLADNKARCVPPLPDEEVEKIARSVSRYPPDTSAMPPLASGAQSKPAAPWPEPLDSEAFHGLAGDVVHAIEPSTEADPAAILVNFLTFFGNAVGPSPHAVAEADRHRCNLAVVLVGETSKGRKGSSHSHIRELFCRVDPLWAEQRTASGLSSGEGLIWEVRNPIEKMVKGEVEVVDEGITDKRLLVVEAEFSAPLKVMAREGNTLSATIRQAWDSGSLRILTKNSPARATGAHISILGHVTKAELLRYLNDTEAGNGFANRFLWVCVKRSKVLPDGGGPPDYREIVPQLKSALDRARMIGELRRDEEARRIWAEVYPELSEGKPGLFGAVTARAEAQVLRLSVLYAALDGESAIRPVHLAAALALWDYCEASARYIFGDALGDPVADRILQTLRQSPEGLSRTSIYQLLSRHTPSARIEQALRLLQTTGRARCEIKETGGRPLELWRAV